MVLLADEQYARFPSARWSSALEQGRHEHAKTRATHGCFSAQRASVRQARKIRTIWRNARRAFVNAQRTMKPPASAQASWITYIDAVISTYIAGKALEEPLRYLSDASRIRAGLSSNSVFVICKTVRSRLKSRKPNVSSLSGVRSRLTSMAPLMPPLRRQRMAVIPPLRLMALKTRRLQLLTMRPKAHQYEE